MAEFPALPVFTDAYLRDCWHLSDAEHGRYFLLLMLIWQTPGCRIPNDREWIARKMRRTPEAYDEQIKPLVEEFCENSGNWITQKRLTKERDYLRKNSKSQSGRAKSRWNKEKDICPDDAERHASGNAPTPTPTPTPTVEEGIGSAGARNAVPEPLAGLETKLREAAGWQSEPAPMLAVTGPVQALIDAGADIDLDVLPVVRALAPKSRGRTSWKYFLNAIAQARDDRIATGKIVSMPLSTPFRGANGRNQQEPTISARQAHIAKLKQRAIDARLREIGEGGHSGGPDIQGPTGDADGEPRLSRWPH